MKSHNDIVKKCNLCTAKEHYDLLIDEDNDAAQGPRILLDYMDKWDGQNFIDRLCLSKEKSVLEIGVGSGRLAMRTAPLCGFFCGIDFSPKTIDRAKENLAGNENVTLICADFNEYVFDRKFDVIYSSLTFMHFKDKQNIIGKISKLLNGGGKFILSTDKNMSDYIDMGTRKIKVFPDNPKEISKYLVLSGLKITEQYETEFANIFVTVKD